MGRGEERKKTTTTTHQGLDWERGKQGMGDIDFKESPPSGIHLALE